MTLTITFRHMPVCAYMCVYVTADPMAMCQFSHLLHKPDAIVAYIEAQRITEIFLVVGFVCRSNRPKPYSHLQQDS